MGTAERSNFACRAAPIEPELLKEQHGTTTHKSADVIRSVSHHDDDHTQSASDGLIILFFDMPKFFNKPPSLSAPARLLSHNMRL